MGRSGRDQGGGARAPPVSLRAGSGAAAGVQSGWFGVAMGFHRSRWVGVRHAWGGREGGRFAAAAAAVAGLRRAGGRAGGRRFTMVAAGFVGLRRAGGRA
jgi:hypothetical protein